jgi:hypothetical protein
MSQQLTEQLGIYVRISRNTALCALAEDLPAPVLADLLDVHITTAVRWTTLVKRDWAKFVAHRTHAGDGKDGRDHSQGPE